MNINIKIILSSLIIIIFISVIIFITGFAISAVNGKGNTNIPNTTDIPAGPGIELTHFSRTTSLVTINATVSDYSCTSLPVYYGVLGENGSINLRFESSGDIRWNVTSEEDAPDVARKIMESYGGLPPDAESDGASIHYSREYNLSRNDYISKKPMFTSISYSQKRVNRYWVVGDSNRLILDLGDNGEPLWISKIWRNYTHSGYVPIIPLDTAIEKLDNLELVHSQWHPEAGDITIHNITVGYYTQKLSNNNTILEPVWMFYGSNATTGEQLGFYVYARQFANFTANPVSGKVPLNVSFSDTSDTSPIKWSWDFGDGTKSPLRNPVHVYQKTGTYNITLTVWNDLGSDTLSKKDYITVLPARTTDLDPVRLGSANTSEKNKRTQ